MLRKQLAAGVQRLRGNPRYTVASLRSLYADMLKNLKINCKNESKMVELVRQAAEMVVYGEQKEVPMFEYFCEKNMLALLVDLMASGSNAVRVQVLQTLGILVQNVHDQRNLYYILSNNHVNELIDLSLSSLPEEVLSQYASFIKTLGLRLDAATVQFFFDHRTRRFAIFGKAMQLMAASREPMIQMAGLTTVLTVIRIPDERLQQWLETRGVLGRLYDLMRDNAFIAVKDLAELLSSRGADASARESSICSAASSSAVKTVPRALGRLDSKVETLQDQFIAFEDVFTAMADSPRRSRLCHSLRHYLLHNVLMPLLTSLRCVEPAVLAARDSVCVLGAALEVAKAQTHDAFAEEQVLAAKEAAAEAAFECGNACSFAVLALQAVVCAMACSEDSVLLHTMCKVLFDPSPIQVAQPKSSLEEMLRSSDRRMRRSLHIEAHKIHQLGIEALDFPKGTGYSYDSKLKASASSSRAVWASFHKAIQCTDASVVSPSDVRRESVLRSSTSLVASEDLAVSGEGQAHENGERHEKLETEETEAKEASKVDPQENAFKPQSRVISAAYLAAACIAVAKCRSEEGISIRVLHLLGLVALRPTAGSLPPKSCSNGLFDQGSFVRAEIAEVEEAKKEAQEHFASDMVSCEGLQDALSESLEACLMLFETDSWKDEVRSETKFEANVLIRNALALVSSCVEDDPTNEEGLQNPGDGNACELALSCALSLILEILLIQTDHIRLKWKSSASLSSSDPVYMQFSELSNSIFSSLGMAASQICDFVALNVTSDRIHSLVSAMVNEAQQMLPDRFRDFVSSGTGCAYNKQILGGAAVRHHISSGSLLRAAASATAFALKRTMVRGGRHGEDHHGGNRASEKLIEEARQTSQATRMMRRMVVLWQMSRTLLLEDPENQFGFHVDRTEHFVTADAAFLHLLLRGDDVDGTKKAVASAVDQERNRSGSNEDIGAVASVNTLILCGPALERAEALEQTQQQSVRESTVTALRQSNGVQATCVLGDRTFQLLLQQRDGFGHSELWKADVENVNVAFDSRGTRCLRILSKSQRNGSEELTSLAFDTEKSCRVVKRHLEKHGDRNRNMRVEALIEVTKVLSSLKTR